MSAPTYFGLGDKNLIMKFFYDSIVAIPGVPTGAVDYQRSYSSAAGPGKEPGAFVNDIIETKEQVLADVVKNTLSVGVVGWVRAGVVGGVNENLWSKLNTFVNAIKVKIRTDPTLGLPRGRQCSPCHRSRSRRRSRSHHQSRYRR